LLINSKEGALTAAALKVTFRPPIILPKSRALFKIKQKKSHLNPRAIAIL
jgi:hypothetical protein